MLCVMPFLVLGHPRARILRRLVRMLMFGDAGVRLRLASVPMLGDAGVRLRLAPVPMLGDAGVRLCCSGILTIAHTCIRPPRGGMLVLMGRLRESNWFYADGQHRGERDEF